MRLPCSVIAVSAQILSTAGAFGAELADGNAPQPVEYVSVCKRYGTGYITIPGTHDCLRIGGYVQLDVGVGDMFGPPVDNRPGSKSGRDTYFTRTRVSTQFDARTQTEFGTLRSHVELFFNRGSLGGPAGINNDSWEIKHAFIQLGGLRVGKSDSIFKTFTLNGGDVVNDQLVPYARIPTDQISYTYKAANGLALLVGAEHGYGAYTVDSYRPHLVAGAALTKDWGSLTSVLGYDSVNDEVAGKVRLDVNAADWLSLWLMGGYGTDRHGDNFYKPWKGNWAIWGGGTASFSKKTSLGVALGYDEDKDFSAVASLSYAVAPGLLVQPELTYKDKFDQPDARQLGGWLRIRRSY